MKDKTIIVYHVRWKPDAESFLKEASFAFLHMAEVWYFEKEAEGKKPQLWKEEITTTFEVMRP